MLCFLFSTEPSTTTTPVVNCGNYSSLSCEKCVIEYGEKGCNGDCTWKTSMVTKTRYCSEKIDLSEIPGYSS